MAVKPSARQWTVLEQIIEDEVSGLTFQFSVSNAEDAPFRLQIFGDLPNGNREILFNTKGEAAASGSALVGACRPSWIRKVKDA